MSSETRITAMSVANMSRAIWLEQRKQGLGGSDMGKVLGVSEWGTPLDVWLDKTGRSEPVEDNDAMWIGRELEDSVAKRYAEENGVQVRRHNFMMIDHENHLVGNIDRLVHVTGTMPAHKGEIVTARALEVKTSGQMPWDELPEHYKAQVHTYMCLAPSIEIFDVAALFYGLQKRMEIFTEHRDNDIVSYIRNVAKEFWEKYVLTDTAPAPQSEADCKKLWASSRGETVRATPDIIDVIGSLQAVREQMKELEVEQDHLRTEVMAFMAEADTLKDAEGKKNLVTWRTAKDREVIDWQAIAKALKASDDVIAAHTTTKPGIRSFRLS